jgi:tryptophan synthase alpha chain
VTTQIPPATRRRSIREAFASLGGRIGLLPFIPAGYPDLATMRLVLPALERGGAAAVEIGIPFSDPIADGPVIQEAFTAALAKKVRLADVFATVATVRGQVSIPLIAMVSYSIVFRYGLERFLKEAKEAGFDGLILPDLPPPEAQVVAGKVRDAGLDTILLVAPTTAPERRAEVARLCSGFVYYLSVAGTTGERDKLPADLEANLRQLRTITRTPVCVGFGVSNPQHVKQLNGLADGAIVGSAVVRRMQKHLEEGAAGIAAAVEDYCRELLSQVQ